MYYNYPSYSNNENTNSYIRKNDLTSLAEKALTDRVSKLNYEFQLRSEIKTRFKNYIENKSEIDNNNDYDSTCTLNMIRMINNAKITKSNLIIGKEEADEQNKLALTINQLKHEHQNKVKLAVKHQELEDMKEEFNQLNGILDKNLKEINQTIKETSKNTNLDTKVQTIIDKLKPSLSKLEEQIYN